MAFLLEDKKIVIGIPFSYSSDWIGGVYYIYNIVNALGYLRKSNIRIEFLIERAEDLEQLQGNISYNNWGFRYFNNGNISRFEKLVFKIFKVKPHLFRKVDCLYLFTHKNCFDYFPSSKIVYWIGDLQNRFYPEYFDEKSLKKRLSFQDFISIHANSIIATSYTMKDEFTRFYPSSKVKINVVKFSITAREISEIGNSNNILSKYNLANKFFYTPNQFWAHKNHILLIHSFLEIVKIYPAAQLIFTGKEIDRRNPHFFSEVKKTVDELSLNSNVIFLGFIPRIDQLQLIQKAHLIVQPSLYEGWSTVIEDAKIMGKLVVASDIMVHREQLGDKGIYFNVNNSNDLTNLMLDYYKKDIAIVDYNYDNQILKSANSFVNAFNR